MHLQPWYCASSEIHTDAAAYALQDLQGQQQQQQKQQPVSMQASSATAAAPVQAAFEQSGFPAPDSSMTSSSADTSYSWQQQPSQMQQSISQGHASAAEEEMTAAQPDSVLPEEIAASQHAQAMTPGIDALRKRRAQKAEQHQQAVAQTTAPAVDLRSWQASQQKASEPADHVSGALHAQHNAKDDAAGAAMWPAAASSRHSDQSVQESVMQDSAGIGQHKKDEALDRNQAPTVSSSPPSDSNSSDAAGQQRHQQQSGLALSDAAVYDNLLDAIAGGQLEWEAPAEQAAATGQASNSEASEQQHSSHQQGHPAHSNLIYNSQQQQQQQRQQPLLWPESGSNAEAEAKPAEAPQQNRAAPMSSRQPTQEVSSQHTALPGQHLEQKPPVVSQHSAALQSSPSPAESDASTSSAARQQASARSVDISRNTEQPTFSSDVVARSSRLRLRRALPKSKPVQQASKQTSGRGGSKQPTPLSRMRSTSRGTMQETKWRVIKSEEATAEDFAKRPSEVESQRPAWAVSASSIAKTDAEEEDAQPHAQAGSSALISVSRPLTKSELSALATRRGLNYEKLLADALARGIAVTD